MNINLEKILDLAAILSDKRKINAVVLNTGTD